MDEPSLDDRKVREATDAYDQAIEALEGCINGFIRKIQTTERVNDPDEGMFDRLIQGYSARHREIAIVKTGVDGREEIVDRATSADIVFKQLRNGESQLTVETWFEGDASEVMWALEYRFASPEGTDQPTLSERKRLQLKLNSQILDPLIKAELADVAEELCDTPPNIDMSTGWWHLTFVQRDTPGPEQILGLCHEISSAQRDGSSMCRPNQLDQYGFDILFAPDEIGLTITFEASPGRPSHRSQHVINRDQLRVFRSLIDGSRGLGGLIRETELTAQTEYGIDGGAGWRDVV